MELGKRDKILSKLADGVIGHARKPQGTCDCRHGWRDEMVKITEVRCGNMKYIVTDIAEGLIIEDHAAIRKLREIRESKYAAVRIVIMGGFIGGKY